MLATAVRAVVDRERPMHTRGVRGEL